jgi:hypothetical protein
MSALLDLEQTRLTFTDGLCSLRLREACEWEGALYESVTAVVPVPLQSGGVQIKWGGVGVCRMGGWVGGIWLQHSGQAAAGSSSS